MIEHIDAIYLMIREYIHCPRKNSARIFETNHDVAVELSKIMSKMALDITHKTIKAENGRRTRSPPQCSMHPRPREQVLHLRSRGIK